MTSRWPEIDALFHSALERPTEQRRAFLDEACGSDLLLREEVESLLACAPEVGDFLERPAIHGAAVDLVREVDPSGIPDVPGFTILRLLGEGGMGVVYLAEQTEPLQRQVAIKFIKHGMDSRKVIARFEAERQTLALMQHPQIAAALDAGTTSDGRPFFVMEFVDGQPITTYCDRRKLSIRDRLKLFVDVCAAVQHAHQKGVIHRDLKPSNVLVGGDDERPLAKVIDFGIAKAVERSLTSDTTSLTDHGILVGTPEYMSPELASLSNDIDTSTDVYSLGMILYELLAGSLPFDWAQLRAAGYDEMRRSIRESEPPQPSSRLTSAAATADEVAAARRTHAARLNRQLRGDLDWITLKALEKDRRRRYSTVAALAADIARYLADEPVMARPPSSVYRFRKFSRRYRAAVIGSAAVLLALTVGLAISIAQYTRAEGQRIEAERQRAQADGLRNAAEAAAREASAQRAAAMAFADEAGLQRAIATREAESAFRSTREAQYRAYTATIAAADGEIRSNLARAARERLLAVPTEYRGWEWQHLLLKTDPSVMTLESPSPCARPGDELAFPTTVSDGLLSFDEQMARLMLRRCEALETWDSATFARTTYRAPGKILAVGPAARVLVLDRLALGTNSIWRLRLLDSRTGATHSQLGPFETEPICADFDRGGIRIAIGLMPQVNARGEPMEDFFDVWDVRAGRRLYRLSPRKPAAFDTRVISPITCMVSFSPNDALLATSGSTIHVWKADTGLPHAEDEIQAGSVAQPLAWAPDGRRLAIGRLTGLVDVMRLEPAVSLEHLDANGLIRVLPIPDGDRRTLVTTRKRNAVLTVAFSPDGSRVVSGRDSSVDIWDVPRKQMLQSLAGHSVDVNGAAIDDGGRVFSADVSGRVKIWLLPSRPFRFISIPSLPGKDIVVDARGTVVGVAQQDGGLYAVQLDRMMRTPIREGSGTLDLNRIARALAISPDGRHLYTSELDAAGTVRAWNRESGQNEAMAMHTDLPGCENTAPNNPFNPVQVMQVSPDGRALAFKQHACVIVRDLRTKEILATLRRSVQNFVFRPDGMLILTLSDPTVRQTPGPKQATIALWDWKRNSIRAEVPTPLSNTPFDHSWWVQVSANGQYIGVVGRRPATVAIWDGDLRRERHRLSVPADTTRIAFSHDGSRLATAGGDTSVRIWDVERNQLLLLLTDDERHTGGIAFTADGRLVAGRSSGGLTIWDSTRDSLSKR